MLPELGATTVRDVAGFAAGDACSAPSTPRDSNGAVAALTARPAVVVIHRRRSMLETDRGCPVEFFLDINLLSND